MQMSGRPPVVPWGITQPVERTKANESILTLLQDNSLEICLYVPQEVTHKLEVGTTVTLTYDPDPPVIHCQVTRMGDALEAAPEQIARHYFFKQKLLPVYCSLPVDVPPGKFRLYAVVKMAR